MKYFKKITCTRRKKSSLGRRIVSQGNNVLFLRKGPSSLERRVVSPKINVVSPRKGPSSLGNNHVPNFFQSQPSHVRFIQACDLSLERSQGRLQFCSWKHFNQNLYEKVKVTQNFRQICSLKHMVGPKEQPSPLRRNGPKLPQGATMALEEKKV